MCFERVEKWADDYDEFMKALRVTDLTDSEPIILLGMYSPYDYRGVELLQSLVTALLVVLGGWFLLSTTPSTNLKELQRIKERKPDLMAKIERLEWFDLIIPHKEWVVTPIILIINAIVYFLMIFSGKGFLTFQADDLISWGACYAPLVRGGEWWQLLTASFLHGGVGHLFANTVCLVYVGMLLEPLINRFRYICIYLLSAVVGGVVSLIWHAEPVVAVGASGAIFGLYGTYIALLIRGLYPKSQTKLVLKEIVIFVAINLLAGLLPGIDNAAHIGGLLCGLLLGFLSLPSCKRF